MSVARRTPSRIGIITLRSTTARDCSSCSSSVVSLRCSSVRSERRCAAGSAIPSADANTSTHASRRYTCTRALCIVSGIVTRRRAGAERGRAGRSASHSVLRASAGSTRIATSRQVERPYVCPGVPSPAWMRTMMRDTSRTSRRRADAATTRRVSNRISRPALAALEPVGPLIASTPSSPICRGRSRRFPWGSAGTGRRGTA